MHRISFLRRWLPLAAAVALLVQMAPPAAAAEPEEAELITRVRRLTFEGRRAGEGYFSPDGRFMVFQSEREEGNPFFQIYRMDRETGETELVSPGTGKTTCAFIRPGTGDVLFASTHHDPRALELQREELEMRARGEEKRYAWDYDPEMELWVRERESGELVRITNARGYDAEASYSPDGEWIVFSSTRSAYDHELSLEEAKQLEIDPSYFGEIYIARADGSDVRRLTHTPGYDGGPFFWPDGSRVLWRRFSEDGLTADVWTMRPDGSDPLQLTDFDAMSWAPYAHPTGEYVLFASNKLGFTNFEVYMVDAAGTKQPVRVTYSDGFDGLPVPTPDGKELVWTSTRHGEKGGQLFIGRWNHEKALDLLSKAPPRDGAGAGSE